MNSCFHQPKQILVWGIVVVHTQGVCVGIGQGLQVIVGKGVLHVVVVAMVEPAMQVLTIWRYSFLDLTERV